MGAVDGDFCDAVFGFFKEDIVIGFDGDPWASCGGHKLLFLRSHATGMFLFPATLTYSINNAVDSFCDKAGDFIVVKNSLDLVDIPVDFPIDKSVDEFLERESGEEQD